MSAPIIEIKDFSAGTTKDITRDSGFATVFECDIHRNPGQLRVQSVMVEDDGDIFDTNEEYLKWMEAYDENGGSKNLYGYGHEGGFYYRNSGTWEHIRDNSNGSNAAGFKRFENSLYYTSSSRLGKLTGDPTVGGNWTDTHKNLKVNNTTGDNPMEVFAGSLFIGNDRYVAKLESDETTFDDEALTLPEGYKVAAMIEWNDYLVIATKSTIAVTNEIIALWDGVSEFPEQILVVPKPGATALFNHNNQLKAFIGKKIYRFTGSDFVIEKQLPKTGIPGDDIVPEVHQGSVDLYEERMIFGTDSGQENINTFFLDGLYTYGRHSEEYPFALTYDFAPSTGATSRISMGAVKIYGSVNNNETVYCSYYDTGNDRYIVDVLDYNGHPDETAYLLTNAFELSGEFGRLVEGVELEFSGAMNVSDGTCKVTVYYRTDEDIDPNDDTTNFTELGVIDNDPAGNNNMGEVLRGVYARCKKIQFKFLIKDETADSDGGVAINRIKIY